MRRKQKKRATLLTLFYECTFRSITDRATPVVWQLLERDLFHLLIVLVTAYATCPDHLSSHNINYMHSNLIYFYLQWNLKTSGCLANLHLECALSTKRRMVPHTLTVRFDCMMCYEHSIREDNSRQSMGGGEHPANERRLYV
jgi:hypothetical protein